MDIGEITIRHPSRALRALVIGLACSGVPYGCYMGDAYVQVTGSVSDPSGSPVPGAAVTLAPAPAPESDCRERPMTTTTDPAGRLAILLTYSPATRRSVFVLRIEKEGFRPYETRVSRDTYNLLITLSPVEEPSPIRQETTHSP
jgi:hypothetical protein